MAWPEFEPMTSRSEVHHTNHYTIEASYKKGQIFYVELYNVLLFCEVKIKMQVTYNECILTTFDFSNKILLKRSLRSAAMQCQRWSVRWRKVSLFISVGAPKNMHSEIVSAISNTNLPFFQSLIHYRGFI